MTSQIQRTSRRTCPVPPARRAACRGVTLIELMIALAIVAVLMAVALPGYRDSMRKSTRAEAQAWMIAAAGRQQQFLVDRRSFATTVAEIGIPVPAGVAAGYTLSLALVDGPPPTFSLQAVPRSGQIGERCATLSINQTGTRTAAVAGCW